MEQIQVYSKECEKITAGVRVKDIYGQEFIILDNIVIYVTPDKLDDVKKEEI